MFASISSIESRSEGNAVTFDIDEMNYFPESNRVISKKNTLDGTTHVTDWGFPQGNRTIYMRDIVLSRADYDTLIAMKEDEGYEFVFTYKTKTYKVIINSAQGLPALGVKMRTSIVLAVVENYPDMETS